MFEEMKQHKRIVVSGSQRSGTRICAKMIAQDTGLKYIDEIEYLNNPNKTIDDVLKEENIVVHAPAVSHRLKELDAFIVYMIRDTEDIIKSQNRISWSCEKHEIKKFGKTDGIISEVKFDSWNKQRLGIKEYQEVKYNSLKKHPLWINKEDRQNFTWNQTKQSI